MSKYYSNCPMLKCSYILHYDEVHDAGYVEAVDGVSVPEVQVFPMPNFISQVGLGRFYMIDAIISAWYSKRVSCEFNEREFIEFAEQYSVPIISSKELGITACYAGLNSTGGFVSVEFSDDVQDIKGKLEDIKFDNDVVDLILPLWDKWSDSIPRVPSSEEALIDGDAVVLPLLHLANYSFYREKEDE